MSWGRSSFLHRASVRSVGPSGRRVETKRYDLPEGRMHLVVEPEGEGRARARVAAPTPNVDAAG